MQSHALCRKYLAAIARHCLSSRANCGPLEHFDREGVILFLSESLRLGMVDAIMK
jgi:hypothetical protein